MSSGRPHALTKCVPLHPKVSARRFMSKANASSLREERMWSFVSCIVSIRYCAFTPSALTAVPPAGYFSKKASMQPSPNTFAASLPDGSIRPYKSSLTFTFSPSRIPIRDESASRPSKAEGLTSSFKEVSSSSRLKRHVIIFVMDAG